MELSNLHQFSGILDQVGLGEGGVNQKVIVTYFDLVLGCDWIVGNVNKST